MNHLDPQLINGMLEKYSHMSEAELLEEARRIKEASGKKEITQEDKNKLFEFVQPILSKEEMEQLKNLLQAFE
ncbi:MAG: hypothetical protein WCS98_02060 [Bacillota bacterium]|nr:hypothetical protein [Bacillota bacterium]MDD3297870.1 hypothetical protein [Bacillota bacterium]MDD3850321.1 hypothetical protein [Bacillota bacterium]MDD4706993.1 hypothetical protein [Bacillota bacterium]